MLSSRRPTRRVAQSARLIGSLQVQNRASLGGNICNAAPSADAVPALICYRARVRIAGPTGQREEAVEISFAGPGRTGLAAGELLVSIVIPPVAPSSAATYLRFTPRREMDIAIAGAAAWVCLDADGRIAAARVVLASVGRCRCGRFPPNGRCSANAPHAPCSRWPANSRPPRRGPSRTHVPPPTTAARWSVF